MVLVNRIVHNNVIRHRIAESLEYNRDLDSLFFYIDGSLGTAKFEDK